MNGRSRINRTVASTTGSGKCYAGQCYSHQQLCLTLAMWQPTYGVTDECHSNPEYSDTGGDQSCQDLGCQQGSAGCSRNFAYDGINVMYASDGTPCGTGQQCLNKQCVASSAFPQVNDAVWKASNWSSCSHICGGNQTRTLTCQRSSTGASVPSNYCPQPPPVTQSTCAAVPACYQETQWNITSDWSTCSATCRGIIPFSLCYHLWLSRLNQHRIGSGVKTRTVICIDTLTAGVVWPDTSCNATLKPLSSQPCNTNITCPAVSSSSASSLSSSGSNTGQHVNVGSSSGSADSEVESLLNKELVSGRKPSPSLSMMDIATCMLSWANE